MGTLVTGVSSLYGISPPILNWFFREEFNILFAQVLQEPPKRLPHLQICDPHLPATKKRGSGRMWLCTDTVIASSKLLF
jgi:hypothetical protein